MLIAARLVRSDPFDGSRELPRHQPLRAVKPSGVVRVLAPPCRRGAHDSSIARPLFRHGVVNPETAYL